MADQTRASALAERLDTLEMRITYQDDMIEQLNTVIVKQWHTLTQAQGRIERLEQRIRESQDSGAQSTGDDPPPPHY